MTPTELWLPIGAAAFYLYDSSCLLWQNELMLTRARRRWLVSGGSELRLAGRRLFLPNPLLPLRPQFQVRWSLAETRADAVVGNEQLLRALRPVGVLNQLQLLLLLALPLLAWTLGAGLLLLLLFVLFYLLTLAALATAWCRRSACGLGTRAFWLLALDALACAPFAVNLTRKLSMRHGIAGDPLQFAAQQLDAAGRAATRQIIAARLQEEQAMSGEPADEERARQLLSKLEIQEGQRP
jgi:hypothetical protein